MNNIYGMYNVFKISEDTDKRNEEVTVNNYDKAVIKYQLSGRNFGNYFETEEVFRKVIPDIKKLKMEKGNKYKEIYVIFDVMYTADLLLILLTNFRLRFGNSDILNEFFIEVLRHTEFELIRNNIYIEEDDEELTFKVRLTYKIH